MVDWKSKLTSRKLWTAVASFVALLVVALGGTQNQATQITAIIMAGASVVAYIVGEGMIDAAGAAAPTINLMQGTSAGQKAIASSSTPTEMQSTSDEVTAPTTSAPHATFLGLGNVTMNKVNAAVEAMNIALSKATNDIDKAQLTSALAALKALQAAKAGESRTAASNTTGAK